MKRIALMALYLAAGCAPVAPPVARPCVAVLFDNGMIALGELTGRGYSEGGLTRYEVDFGKGVTEYIRYDAMEYGDRPCRRK